jgi:hypothetical protein
MTKPVGTNRVVFDVRCGTRDGAEHFMRNFAPRARFTTITDLAMQLVREGQHDWVVAVSYTHLCRNYGNAASDARRFVARAFLGTTYRWEVNFKRQYRWHAVGAYA